MLINAFYFTSKALFVLNALKFLYLDFKFLTFCFAGKQLHQKDRVNFKICDIATWGINNCNIYILTNISKNENYQLTKFGQLIENPLNKTIFLPPLSLDIYNQDGIIISEDIYLFKSLRSGVVMVNVEQISEIMLVFLILISKKVNAG